MGQTVGLNSILRSTLAKIDEQIHVYQNEVEKTNELYVAAGNPERKISVYQLQNTNGEYVMTPLLLARSNVLLAIAIDNQK